MKVSKSSLLTGAAFAGLMGGTMTRLAAAPSGGMSPQDNSQKSTGKASKKSTVEKHSCSGKNSCKGKGGCSTSDNGCKGKNSCKGKGGCSTDGSKK
ncbi:MAG: hypothetical protein ABSF62_16345 [Bryobacteraceae bacterium]|jgi:hypothetical protein